MTINEALVKVASRMELAAKHFRDLGIKKYSTEAHANAAGYCIAQAIKDGVEPSAENLRDLFYALYNQSAWRQKFEKAKLFAKAEDQKLDDLVKSLTEEEV